MYRTTGFGRRWPLQSTEILQLLNYEYLFTLWLDIASFMQSINHWLQGQRWAKVTVLGLSKLRELKKLPTLK